MSNTDSYRHDDLHFAMAPLGGRVRLFTYLIMPFLLLFVIVDVVIFRHIIPHKVMMLHCLWPSALVMLAIGLCWHVSRIRELKLDGNTLFVRLPWWGNRFELAGLQSIEADPQALKGAWKKMGNDGLGGMIGSFHSKRQGAMRVYVSDPAKSVVLRWADRIVVVSPKDTDWFIESVRKRTGL